MPWAATPVSYTHLIANLTRRYAEKLEGTGVRLLDTRKTMPGLRYPDKYAVLCGGGHNHRRNLAEMLMLKAVSYTHLDVYKRQLMDHPGFSPCLPRRTAYYVN